MKLMITYLGRDDGEDKSFLIHEEVQELADTYMGEDATIGEIFRAMRREYGRCTSKVYVDTKSRHVGFGQVIPSQTKQIGWVFVKRRPYEDSERSYMQEVWVSLLDSDDTVRTVKHHYI